MTGAPGSGHPVLWECHDVWDSRVDLTRCTLSCRAVVVNIMHALLLTISHSCMPAIRLARLPVAAHQIMCDLWHLDSRRLALQQLADPSHLWHTS